MTEHSARSILSVRGDKSLLFVFSSLIFRTTWIPQHHRRIVRSQTKKQGFHFFSIQRFRMNHELMEDPALGRSTVKVLPFFGSLVTWIEPPWASTILLAIVRPNPEPLSALRVLLSTW